MHGPLRVRRPESDAGGTVAKASMVAGFLSIAVSYSIVTGNRVED